MLSFVVNHFDDFAIFEAETMKSYLPKTAKLMFSTILSLSRSKPASGTSPKPQNWCFRRFYHFRGRNHQVVPPKNRKIDVFDDFTTFKVENRTSIQDLPVLPSEKRKQKQLAAGIKDATKQPNIVQKFGKNYFIWGWYVWDVCSADLQLDGVYSRNFIHWVNFFSKNINSSNKLAMVRKFSIFKHC